MGSTRTESCNGPLICWRLPQRWRKSLPFLMQASALLGQDEFPTLGAPAAEQVPLPNGAPYAHAPHTPPGYANGIPPSHPPMERASWDGPAHGAPPYEESGEAEEGLTCNRYHPMVPEEAYIGMAEVLRPRRIPLIAWHTLQCWQQAHARPHVSHIANVGQHGTRLAVSLSCGRERTGLDRHVLRRLARQLPIGLMGSSQWRALG